MNSVFYFNVFTLLTLLNLVGCMSHDKGSRDLTEFEVEIQSEVLFEMASLTGVGGFGVQYVEVSVVKPQDIEGPDWRVIVKEGLVAKEKNWLKIGSMLYPIGSHLIFSAPDAAIDLNEKSIDLSKCVDVISKDAD